MERNWLLDYYQGISLDAELELVRDAVQMNTLTEAFELLKILDDPIDPFEAMEHLCRANWLREEKIDYFDYRLKKKAN